MRRCPLEMGRFQLGMRYFQLRMSHFRFEARYLQLRMLRFQLEMRHSNRQIGCSSVQKALFSVKMKYMTV